MGVIITDISVINTCNENDMNIIKPIFTEKGFDPNKFILPKRNSLIKRIIKRIRKLLTFI